MKKLINIIIILSILKICISLPKCIEGENYCFKCNPVTKLCAQCNLTVLTPNEKGECIGAKKCTPGSNKCLECAESGDLCKTCEANYFPDENGACSYTRNCEVSYRGNCLKCKEDFALLGQNIKMCKSLMSEDLKHCETFDQNTGICQRCQQNYFLNSGDNRCSPVENCFESSFDNCKKCNSAYYLNKKENKCKLQRDDDLKFCAESLDGINCDKCEDDCFFDEKGKCYGIRHCSKGVTFSECEQCKEGYYLTEYLHSCTTEKNCYQGDRYLGICTKCKDNYFIDFNDGKCKSNQEDNDYKYCSKADKGHCYYCSFGYDLGEDLKCSSTRHCAESELGVCIVCRNGFYLGKDNRCTTVERCAYSNFIEECIECEENYYYDKTDKRCKIAEGNFINCNATYNREYCDACKNDFYLNKTDKICYSNKERGKYYKCTVADYYSDYSDYSCSSCIEGYYLGSKYNLCNKIEGCEKSDEENENKCVECDEFHCLDLKTGKCEKNYIIENEEKSFYYRCNMTNEEGIKCEICNFGLNLDENGKCVDLENCEEFNEDKTCKKCKSNEDENHCLNEIFGCIEIYDNHCLECNDILYLNKCTKCAEGYEVGRFGQCTEIF